jgi:2-C-methyl-D-erythritol 4-phosphate cytidylyltransferase/2-C-methyl-D-erythritol 2,4-cyclodiphosphate synthase
MPARSAGESVPSETLPPADAIVVAAGGSSRMAGVDKLAHRIGGRPLLSWSIDALAAVDAVERIVVVAPVDRVSQIRDAPWLSGRVVAVVAGGTRRHESVAAGLEALDALDVNGDGAAARDRVVLVHDGARPAASPELVRAVLAAAAEHGAAIPVLAVTDTIKRIADGQVAETVDRSVLASAQTPQGARRRLLRDAFARFPPAGPETWTDEAALLEACNIPVHALAGEPGNLKVTLPADLDRAAALLDVPAPSGGMPRIGTGFDSHPFGPGAPLALGGIEIPGAFRLHGHSDGDVALHAIADALLGAAGLGDLGRIFPAGSATPRGIASGELLTGVVARVRAAGYRPSSIDVTIVAGRPRLAGVLDEMRDTIAGLLDLAPEAVNVKASTGNLSGMEGAGRGISAAAVAMLERTK